MFGNRARKPQRGDRGLEYVGLEYVEYDRRDSVAVPMFCPAGAQNDVGRNMIPRLAPWASMLRP